MEVRLSKKNETVTITLNADELWNLRFAAGEAWWKLYNEGNYNLASMVEPLRDETNKAFKYLSRNWD